MLAGDCFLVAVVMPLFAATVGWYMWCYLRLVEFRCPKCNGRFAVNYRKFAAGGSDVESCKHCGCPVGWRLGD
ncbi:hypothetical protein KOR34_30180 [Posidoniimonas corsicana]|uniref:Uncharacterized protein n=1 Tax=Posidoniimonas corsicana TaxID=1938618 RepID=A0A5C5VJE6_9BACT|nr:hypothetical protein KOR34_30180 [Posidoniimonas corsicana]